MKDGGGEESKKYWYYFQDSWAVGRVAKGSGRSMVPYLGAVQHSGTANKKRKR